MNMLDVVVDHWTFLTVMLVLAMMGQMMKGLVFTKSNIVKYKKSTPWLGEALWWLRKTLPMHPVIAGAFLGMLFDLPLSRQLMEAGNPETATRMLYFAGAGLASTWAFALVKAVAKKQDIELDMPEV